jgi:hypothetical protein
MPSGIFVIHWDDMRGLVIEKRYPSSLILNEKILNLINFENQQGGEVGLKKLDIESMKIASYTHIRFPGWIVCFVLSDDETSDFDSHISALSGIARFIVELINVEPELVDIEEILTDNISLDEPEEEQIYAEIFVTPSAAILLEKMEFEGVEKAAKLSMWLKNQTQTDNLDIRDVAAPLLKSGVLQVERIGKTTEAVFLAKDVFFYRAPPVESIEYALETMPPIAEEYMEYINNFFSPEPPNKGYNPTIPDDDPNSPLIEDREKTSELLKSSFHYLVLKALRSKPMLIEELSEETNLPVGLVQKVLWTLEANKITVNLKGTGHWALATNPIIQSFMPEYVLPVISKKVEEKEITTETAKRYLDILLQNWGDKK